MGKKLLILLGAAVLGACTYKYVTEHREELDEFLEEYDDADENEFFEEDLVEPPVQ